MRGSWIRNGDIAVVDCSIEPLPGQVAVLDGDMLIKQLGRAPTGEVLLLPTNKRYPTRNRLRAHGTTCTHWA